MRSASRPISFVRSSRSCLPGIARTTCRSGWRRSPASA